ncbi:hypothetical protein [Marinifilum sp.]|uniref:hypothetical protein n=1 Tax=Marinifilum sp. TaxID=2033137 RepID=UPI003BAAE428
MKTNTFFYTLLIALCSLTLVSCDHSDDDFGQREAQSSISIKVLKSNLKYGDDDVQIPDWPITLEGKTMRNLNVTLESKPEPEIMKQTTSDDSGVFYFDVEEPGEYLIKVNHQDGFAEELEISLE